MDPPDSGRIPPPVRGRARARNAAFAPATTSVTAGRTIPPTTATTTSSDANVGHGLPAPAPSGELVSTPTASASSAAPSKELAGHGLAAPTAPSGELVSTPTASASSAAPSKELAGHGLAAPTAPSGELVSSPTASASSAAPSKELAGHGLAAPTAPSGELVSTPTASVVASATKELAALALPQNLAGASRSLSRVVYEVTRPKGLACKTAPKTPETTINLVTNYFQANLADDWAIHQYAVSFNPPFDDDQTLQRKRVFRLVVNQLPPNIFDGLMLFTVEQLPQIPMVLTATDNHTNLQIEVIIDSHKAINPGEPECIQIYNIFVRKCMESCKLVPIGRKHFDPTLATSFPQFKLAVWPGFNTSLRYHEDKLLLNVENVSKVIRTQSVLDHIAEARSRASLEPTEDKKQKRIAEEIEGRIVVTTYNNRTYPIQAIRWDLNPTHTFEGKNGERMSFIKYYETKYQIKIKNERQPLLEAAQKEKDIRRFGLDMKKAKSIILVPETCVLTGLTDAMRSNFNLMKEIGKVIFVEPHRRVTTLESFIKTLDKHGAVKHEMDKWRIHFQDKLLRMQGRMLTEEKILAGGKTYTSLEFSKGGVARGRLHDPKELKDWVVILPAQSYQEDFLKFLSDMEKVNRPMGFRTDRPTIKVCVRTGRELGFNSYQEKIKEVMNEKCGRVSLFFIVLQTDKPELYTMIKDTITRGYGLPSQCCLAKNLKKGLSVATKIAIQMSCKVGGVPWIVQNPLKERNLCVIGFDVYHSAGTQGSSFGAIVATINSELSKCCSFVQRHAHREEICSNMGTQVEKCLQEYKKANGRLPERIMLYRDGVGDGQVNLVYKVEVVKVQGVIQSMYNRSGAELPKLSYIIVTKRINTRFMVETRVGVENPRPGAVVDDVITLPYRYDFYLVSQIARQGTVSPTSYNIILDESGLAPSRMQQFTYKLCHNYYNWMGTISVPSVCQNAHKLAYITGESIKESCHENLRLLPFYL